MPFTTVLPSKNRVRLPGTRWTPSTGLNGQMWDRINNTVENPDDTDHITALALDVDEDFGFDTTAMPERTSDIHTIIVQFRFLGLEIDNTPGIIFELWTDFPTVLARKIAELEVDIDTANVLTDGQITFTGLGVTTDEAKSIRCIPLTVGDPFGPPPDPFEEFIIL